LGIQYRRFSTKYTINILNVAVCPKRNEGEEKAKENKLQK
jgi:hypothetical protein